MNIRRLPVAALFLLVLAAGCSKGPSRREITGKVTYDGTPVVYGTIYFEPDRAAGHPGGPQGSGEIRDGVYKTNPDYGPVPGPTVIRITGWDQKPGGVPPVFSNYETHVDLPDADQKDLDFNVPLVKGKRK